MGAVGQVRFGPEEFLFGVLVGVEEEVVLSLDLELVLVEHFDI